MTTLLDVDQAQNPIDLSECNLGKLKSYPACILGFKLKNKYDQQRLKFKNEYNIKDYTHNLTDAERTLIVFRGLLIQPKQEMLPLLRYLDNISASFTDLPSRKYECVLNEYNLSSSNCYGSLQRGVYPINSELLETFTSSNIDINDLYENSFDTSEIQRFQSLGYFTIFVLSTDTAFTVKEA